MITKQFEIPIDTNNDKRYIRGMETYTVLLPRRVEKRIGKFPVRVRGRLEKFFELLETNPTPEGSKKMGGYERRWRYEFSDGYRVLYEVYRSELRVLIVKAGPRGDVYK